jgi:hypothetical protein
LNEEDPTLGHRILGHPIRFHWMPLLASMLTMTAIVGVPFLARGGDFHVTTEADAAHWKPSLGRCTLRAAIMAANAQPGPDRVVVPAGTYSLSEVGRVEDYSMIGDLDVTDDLVIEGAGADVTIIDGLGSDRVLDVHGARVAVFDLRIANGATTQIPEPGGAIRSSGALTLVGVWLSDSWGPIAADCQTPSRCDATRSGGAIASTGSLSLQDVRVDGLRVGRERAEP